MSVRSLAKTALLGSIALGGLSFGAQAAPVETDLTYAVLRDGDEVGRHQVTLTRDDDQQTTVAIKTNVVVKVALVPVYRFEQNGSETWRQGHLTALSTKTNDDGDKHSLDAKAAGDHVEVVSDGTHTQATADVIPASLWNHDLVNQKVLLNTINGKAMAVKVADLGVEAVRAQGHSVQAHHYRVTGELDRDLWYDPANTLVQIGFKASDNSSILYVLR
jgi:hypothetical protein